MTAEYIDEVLISLKKFSRNGVLTLETQSTGVLDSLRRWMIQGRQNEKEKKTKKHL